MPLEKPQGIVEQSEAQDQRENAPIEMDQQLAYFADIPHQGQPDQHEKSQQQTGDHFTQQIFRRFLSHPADYTRTAQQKREGSPCLGMSIITFSTITAWYNDSSSDAL